MYKGDLDVLSIKRHNLYNDLIDLRRKNLETRFGAHPEMTEFTESDEGEFHEL